MQGRKRFLPKQKHKSESQILRKRLKEETRGAMKEIRKDSAFVANEMYKDQRRNDADERQKVRRIIASLQGQEADFKKLQNEKSKMKKKRR